MSKYQHWRGLLKLADLKQRLKAVGLSDIDIDSCSVKDTVIEKLVQLLENYNDVFSKHTPDCGEVRDFVHCIRLIDEHPFRLPYRRVPPGHLVAPSSFRNGGARNNLEISE